MGTQVQKIAVQFGCDEVILVGDHGMIKSPQIAELPDNFHYITAITKPQIETLVKHGTFQSELFDTDLCEVEDGNIRYILRRNPIRAAEIVAGRQSKLKSATKLVTAKNLYLSEHPKANVEIAMANVQTKLENLKIDGWVMVKAEGRVLHLEENEAILKQLALLDGCYALKTDLSPEILDQETVHDRYKDLALVEKAFREMKRVNLEMRPVFGRTQQNTIGHAEIVMLAYMVIRRLEQAWASFNLTVAEGVQQLENICVTELSVNGHITYKIPEPGEVVQKLLAALQIRLPELLVPQKVKIVTRKKLSEKS